MKISEQPDININRVFLNLVFELSFHVLVLGKTISKITPNFDGDQHYYPYLENNPMDLNENFTAA